MKKRADPQERAEAGFPTADELAALRAWYEGLPARAAIHRYLGHQKLTGQSSRAMVSAVRGRLAKFARNRQREDLAQLLEHPAAERQTKSSAVFRAIEVIRELPVPAPQITDKVSAWLSPRVSNALERQGLRTLSELTVRVPRRRRWWTEITGLGQGGARQVEAFFAAHPELTERARALVPLERSDVKPWEDLFVPTDVDGSQGTFRAPRATCSLSANHDYVAVQAWLSLQESPATQRAYRKEAERLMLWAILDRGKALSSLNTEDAIAYRQFLRRPTPRDRWVGPARPRTSPQWRPFQGALSARSAAYALSVVGALFRWLIEQRYTLANPFAGVKVKAGGRTAALDATRAFTDHEWLLVRQAADTIEWTEEGWSKEAAQRLRFVLDFWFATGLRLQEMVAAVLGHLQEDEHAEHWLRVTGKGSKVGDVAVPLMARAALERFLAERGLPTTRARWLPSTPLVPSLGEDGAGITAARLRRALQRFFEQVATQVEDINPTLADKLLRATPHWLRHTHATHALSSGADLTTVRDNLRHASISTTSVYLHTDRVKRARQLGAAFEPRSPKAS